MDPVIPLLSLQFLGGIVGATAAGMFASLVLFWLYTSRS